MSYSGFAAEKFSDVESEILRVFNFTILGYSRISRKLDWRWWM